MSNRIRSAITNLLLLTVIQTVTCKGSTDPKTFFPAIDGNLTRIVWAHAVNNQSKLNETLKNGDIMMLEADVSLGNVTGTNSIGVPIMAHPPANTSDLSLQDFLKMVVESNTTKGIKLDFKSLEAFEASIPVLEKKKNDLSFPVFINADILPGPVNATTTAVDAKSFLSKAKAFPNYTLSVGWTTRYGGEANITNGGYTQKQIESMTNVLKEENVTQPITYPVRAGLVANDIDAIESLMKQSQNNATLTIWSSDGDLVNAERLSTLIKRIGTDKVYVDVPDDLKKRLDLSGASSVGIASTTIAVSLLIGTLLSTITTTV
ncbi:protein FAM151B isoform X1 [Hylaeus volcanicus]|uniref:protein FAM151B isoform X1 n=1 Tax=Hylaeus volcanicus TaxID=313075 RepID=UPI0023B81A11|nr:protein FAM151B isoform X1 [Hylaeus volcanicus]